MSQPHPPIPEPQPHPPATGPAVDEPRTQSILLPPGQRPAEQSEQPADVGTGGPPAARTAQWTGSPVEGASPVQPLPGQPDVPPTGEIPAQAGPDVPAHARPTGPVDWVPGFGGEPAGATAVSAPPAAQPASTPGPPPTPGPTTAVAGGTSGPTPHRRSPLAAVQRAGAGGAVALVPLVLGAVAVVLLEVGLALEFGTQSLWDVVPTWSVFATVAALVVLLPAVARLAGRRLPARTAWRLGAAGVAGLAVFWVLVALPLAASDRGFWLTAALAAAAGALWLAPGRPE